MMRHILLLFVFTITYTVSGQVLSPNGTNQTGRGLNSNMPQQEDKQVLVDGEKPPITDYLIITQDRDTSYVDTTLHMGKDYRFNYLRKDDFEYMPLHNVGRPYNELGKTIDHKKLLPQLGAQGRHFAYLGINDMLDYHVPTPLTELYFRTAINQGQQLDALFANNLSPRLNFSIGYKGVRSAGDYVNTLTSTGIFKFTTSYRTKNDKYRLRFHTVFHRLEQQENGGLTPGALQGFIDGVDDLSNRGRLDPNLDDATSLLDGRRFYVNQDLLLFQKGDSTSMQKARVYSTAYLEDKFYRYEESRASNSFLGNSFTDTGLRDQADLTLGRVEAGLDYVHHILGSFKAGVSHSGYNYGYDRLIILPSGQQISNRLKGSIYQFNGAYQGNWGAFKLTGDMGVNVASDQAGQYLKGHAAVALKDWSFNGGLSISSTAPDFNFQLFQSDYIAYNWQTNFNNSEQQEIHLAANSKKWGSAQLSLNTLQDYLYFEQQQVLNAQNQVTGYVAAPRQYDQNISYVKLKYQNDFKLGTYFGTNHTLMYQNVQQSNQVFNVPEWTSRHTFYYKDRWFKNAMQVQMGVTAKYFTKHYMNAYDPVLGAFMVQDELELGGFPLVDAFINAKIRQTRIFVKFEHLNQLFSNSTDYFSAPRMPFRDFSLRFGVVWNFFL